MLGSGMLLWLTSGSHTPQFSPPAYYTSPSTFSNTRFNSLALFGCWQCLISPWSLPGWQQMQTREWRVSPAMDRALPSHGCSPSSVTMGLWHRRRSRNKGQMGPERVTTACTPPGKASGASASSLSLAQQARDKLLRTAETGGKWHHTEAEQGLWLCTVGS